MMTPTRSHIKNPGHIGGENFDWGFLLLIPQVPLAQFPEALFPILIDLPY